MYRPALIILLGLAVLPRTLPAQSGTADGSVDVGTAFLRQPGIGESSVLTAAAQFQYRTLTGELTANGVAARTPNDLYTGQGVLTAARYAPPFQRMRWELATTASGYGVSGAAPTVGGQVLAREHIGNSSGGGFAGIAAGVVGRAGAWRHITGAHAGAFVRFGSGASEELSAALSFTDASAPAAAGAPIRYADLLGYWQHRRGPVALLVGGGARASAVGPLGLAGWGSLSASVWVVPRVALVVSAGRALEDAARGVPSVRYLAVALRFGPTSRAPATLSVARAAPEQDGGRIEVHATSDSMRVVSIRLEGATGVELMADFTDWEPVPMTALPNGEWTLQRPITPGVHRVAIRVSGGAWFTPTNLTRVADDFGGEVGLLVVP